MRDLREIAELPRLTDGHVVLRPWRAEDAAAVTAMCDDESVSRWMPDMPHPYTLADGETWAGDAARKWTEETWANFAVELAGELVASCGLRVDAQKESGEIGYLVHRDRRREGIASACVRLLTHWGFEDLGLVRLQVRADVRNVASRRTIVAAGYRFEGVLRSCEQVESERVDDALYATLRDDPRTRSDGSAAGAVTPARPGWPRLEDDRLVVRPFKLDDAPAVCDACDDPDIAQWIHGVPSPYRPRDAEEFIADARHRLLLGDRARLAVCDARSGELLGSVSVDLRPDLTVAEMGYWVKREARRRGVALGAARLVTRWAFDDLGVERLELMTYPGNSASQALARKLGLTHEGRLRGLLPAEPGKSREGRVVPSSDGSLPPRDDQKLFALLRSERSRGGI